MYKASKTGIVIQQRYVLTAMLFFALVTSISVRACLSLTITQMVREPNADNDTILSSGCVCPITNRPNPSPESGIAAVQDPGLKYHWSQELQGVILSAFYMGYIITHIPGAMLAQKFGGKYVLALSILLSAIMSIVTPVAVQYGNAEALIVIRFLMGFFQGPLFPCISALLSAWVPTKERGRLCSLAFSGMTMGTIASSYLSGLILHNTKRWELVFYFFGILGLLWFFIFIVSCYSNPASHPFITVKEKDYLLKHLGQLERSKTQSGTPWRLLLTSTPVLAIVLAQVAHDWCYFVITTDLPKYMHDVLHVTVMENGVYNAVPWVVRMIVSFVASFVSDYVIKKEYVSVTNARKVAVFLASVFPAAFMVAATYAGCHELLVFSFLIISIGAQGFITCGTMINPMDLSPNYAGAISSLSNAAGSLTGVAAPSVVGLMTTNSYLSEWRLVFLITAGVQLMQTVVFTFMGSGNIQPWNYKEKKALTIQSSEKMAKETIQTIRYEKY